MTALFDALAALGLPLVTLTWALPLAAAIPLASLGDDRARRLAIPLAALPMALVALLAGGLALTRGAPHPLLADALALGPLRYGARLDPINSPFVVLTALLGLLLAIYGRFADKPRFARWAAHCLALEGILLGAQLADTPLLFGLFLLAEIIPVVRLCTGWSVAAPPEARAAARRTALFLATAAALWITGALLTTQATHPQLAFALLFTALAIRMPLFPFHGWLPPLVREGPVVALPVYFVGLEIAALALIRFVLPALPAPALTHAPALAALGVAGLVYGILQAFGRRDLREVLTFASIAHAGFITAGLFTLTAAGLEGGVLEMLNLGISAAGLFFIVGFLYVRQGTTDLGALRGAIAAHPALSFAFLALALTSLGMPGTSGFDGVHLLIEGALEHRELLIAIALGLGAVLVGGTLLYVYQQIAFGEDHPHDDQHRPARDLRRTEALVVLALMGLVFGLGFEATALVDALHGPADQLIHRLDAIPAAERPAPAPAAAAPAPAPPPARAAARPRHAPAAPPEAALVDIAPPAAPDATAPSAPDPITPDPINPAPIAPDPIAAPIDPHRPDAPKHADTDITKQPAAADPGVAKPPPTDLPKQPPRPLEATPDRDARDTPTAEPEPAL